MIRPPSNKALGLPRAPTERLGPPKAEGRVKVEIDGNTYRIPIDEGDAEEYILNRFPPSERPRVWDEWRREIP